MERHDWQLLDESDFCQRLTERARSAGEQSAEGLTREAINIYCEVWHAACDAQGERRNRAYQELARYLYDRALYKYRDPELAHEVTQEAIVLVAEQLGNCQSPGAFMAFAMLKLWNAATAYFRQRDRHSKHTTDLPEADGPQQELSEPTMVASASPEAVAVDADLATAVVLRVGEILQMAPRAENQIKAVVLKFLGSYSDEEIAAELGTDVSNVHVLRSRGLKRLRNDPVLEKLAAEFW